MQTSTQPKTQALHLYFDERDNRTEETQDYSPKGFTEETVLNDFPVRDKKLVLHIRRRRWLRPDGSSCVLDVYPRLVAKGTRFSEEFAGFLKKNLDTTPVTARSLGNTYHVDGDNGISSILRAAQRCASVHHTAVLLFQRREYRRQTCTRPRRRAMGADALHPLVR